MEHSNICAVTIAVASLLFLRMPASGDQPPMLTCNETMTTSLVTLPMDCTKTFFYLNMYQCTSIHRSPKGVNWTILLEVMALSNISMSEPGEETFCAGIYFWSGKTDDHKSNYFITMNSSLTAGVISKIDPENSEGRNITVKVKLRADVLALPPFFFTLDELQFWNFSSPLFRADLRWLKTMDATAAIEAHYPSQLPGLAGSSIRRLQLLGSFGSDARGPLPLLDHMPLLHTFIISSSPLTELAPGILASKRNVRELILYMNQLQEIPAEITLLKNLTSITVESKVQSFRVNPSAFFGLRKLEKIRLSRTPLNEWTGPFPELSGLNELDLSMCKIKKFSSVQSKFISLYELDLSNNLLSSLEPNAFIHMQFLDYLFLNKNYLFYISPDAFLNLDFFRLLDLRFNNLINFPNLSCVDIGELNLSHNKLTHLANLGDQVHTIRLLDVSQNSISYWEDENIFLVKKSCKSNNETSFESVHVFKNISRSSHTIQLSPWVSSVNLSHNRITLFSEAMLQSLSTLKEVDLGGNMIDCGDCHTFHLQHWLGSTDTTVKVLGHVSRLMCYQPPNLKGRFVQEVNYNEACFMPRNLVWLGLGVPVVGVIVFVVLGSVIFYYRTEVAYLVHLAAVRATSKRKKEGHLNNIYDAFVCYSGKNRKWVLKRLTALLERRPEQYKVCLFDRDFRLGTHIVTNIIDAIDQSRKVIVVLSEHFVASKWCQWELEMAQHKLFSEDREFLVLLELEPLERQRLPRLLRFLLDTRPVVRWPRPETAPAVLAAAAQLHGALGPSLRQCPPPAPRPGEEPGPSASAPHERTPLLAN